MRWSAIAVLFAARNVAASPAIRCDDLSTADLSIDGLLDDWTSPVLARAGTAPDAAIELRCSWDGAALGLALDLKDDRVVRVRGKGHEDRVDIAIAAGGEGRRPDRPAVGPRQGRRGVHADRRRARTPRSPGAQGARAPALTVRRRRSQRESQREDDEAAAPSSYGRPS